MTQNNMANHLHKKFYICIQPTQTNNITKTNANPLVCSDDFLVRYEGLLLRLSHIFVALDTRAVIFAENSCFPTLQNRYTSTCSV